MEKTCKNCGTPITKEYCEDNYPEVCEHWTPKKPMTNADRIRAMTDEELAWELMTWRIETEAKHQGVESNYPNTQKAILEWLQAPAEGE